MAIGRISGSVLKSNLTRNGTDLAFETNLLYLDVTNNRVGVGTSEPTTSLDVSGTVKATAFSGDGSGLTGINVSTNIQIVGDDSTGAVLGTGETFKIAGTQNITTAVSGDTLTITGPDLSSYATTSYVDAQNTAQALTFVGDDSTGTAVNSGETFKIAGGTNITTAVSGDTLTITGTAQDFAFSSLTGTPTTLSGYGITDAASATATALTVVGDDSTGTAITLGETFKFSGTGGISASVSGDTLTIDGSSISTNSISEGNSNVTVTDSGTGSITIDADGSTIVTFNATTAIDASAANNAIRLPNGSTAERPSGSVGMIRYNSSTDTIEGYTTAGGWAQLGAATAAVEDSANVVTGEKTAISTNQTVVDSFLPATYDSAFYLAVTRDEINEEVATAKYSVVHNDSSAFVSQSSITQSGSNEHIVVDADVSGGNVRLLATGTSVVNSVSFYRIALGDNTTQATTGNVTTEITADVDSAVASIDSWTLADARGAKYFISVNNATTGELSNIEAMVVHDGSSAYISSYNAVNTGNNDLITLTTEVDSTAVVLKASANAPNCRVTAYRILLADDETSATGDFIDIVGSKTVDSSATAIDTFLTSVYTGAHYVVVGYNTTEGSASIQEVTVVSDGAGAFVTTGPLVSSKDTDQLTFTAELSGTTVTLRAASSAGSSTTVNAYRVHLLRGIAGASTANTVLVDTEQTITGAKTFSGGLLTDTIQSPGSNADITLDPQGTGVVRIKSNILPDVTTTHDIGSDSLRFNDIYLSGTTVNLGGTKIQRTVDGDVEFKDASNNRKTVIVEQIELGTGANRVKLSKRADGGLKITDNTDSRVEILKIVGDDSTGTGMYSGETFKFAGTGGITTSVTEDTLTITGPDLTSYATTAYVDAQNQSQALTFVGDDSTGTAVNSGETFKIAGGTNITTAVSGDTLTVTGPDLTNYLNSTQLTVSGNKISTTESNANIELDPNGTGDVVIDSGDLLPATNGTQNLGATDKRWSNIYTSDLNLNNGIGNYTIVEGEEDLFLYNNRTGKTYKFMLAEVDPGQVPKKMEE